MQPSDLRINLNATPAFDNLQQALRRLAVSIAESAPAMQAFPQALRPRPIFGAELSFAVNITEMDARIREALAGTPRVAGYPVPVNIRRRQRAQRIGRAWQRREARIAAALWVCHPSAPLWVWRNVVQNRDWFSIYERGNIPRRVRTLTDLERHIHWMFREETIT